MASIKFYLREGLLPPGRKSSANQADYGDEHIARLRLIRSLLEVGGLTVANARTVLEALDDEELPWGMAIGVAASVLPASQRSTAPEGDGNGRALLERAAAARGWTIDGTNSGWALAARVLDDYQRLGYDDLEALLDEYLSAVERVARADMAAVAAAGDRATMTEIVVVGTVLGDALLAGLRRLAHEHVSRQVFPLPESHRAPLPPSNDAKDQP